MEQKVPGLSTAAPSLCGSRRSMVPVASTTGTFGIAPPMQGRGRLDTRVLLESNSVRLEGIARPECVLAATTKSDKSDSCVPQDRYSSISVAPSTSSSYFEEVSRCERKAESVPRGLPMAHAGPKSGNLTSSNQKHRRKIRMDAEIHRMPFGPRLDYHLPDNSQSSLYWLGKLPWSVTIVTGLSF